MNVAFNVIVVDALFITICYVIIAQYKVIGQSFRYIGYDEKPLNEYYEDFKSVVADQQKLELKLLSFYSVVHRIVLINVVFTFCSIIIITYLFVERESTNFAIYSCNWTEMDVKFQKLLLLAMCMNNANKLLIRASPKKTINLQFFSSVMMTSYNIVSVMVKTISIENQ
ncbi:Olfactory receptor, insect [Cinara cedri]|uniref:Olfactory receptor, insect n=1 Tax=Cinara cedri TaxID=506608 RepID=A0A5E4MR90_9HEMI|nr:Olfactory receptor, insect [Cinara cedri]